MIYYFAIVFSINFWFIFRIQSLEKSSINLPDSLLLIETNENGRTVIGHSRLTKVLEDPNGCWIGSGLFSKHYQ